MTALFYGQFLLNSQINHTATYPADHFEDLAHDNVQYLLKNSRFAPRQVWSPHSTARRSAPRRGLPQFDDAVLDKINGHKIERLRRQDSGNAYGVTRALG